MKKFFILLLLLVISIEANNVFVLSKGNLLKHVIYFYQENASGELYIFQKFKGETILNLKDTLKNNGNDVYDSELSQIKVYEKIAVINHNSGVLKIKSKTAQPTDMASFNSDVNRAFLYSTRDSLIQAIRDRKITDNATLYLDSLNSSFIASDEIKKEHGNFKQIFRSFWESKLND